MNLTYRLLFLILLLQPLAFCQQATGTSRGNRSDIPATLCSTESLPPGVQKRLAEEFKPWSIQQPDRLSEPALERWKSERPLACPGIAAGHFEHSKMTSYALLLVSAMETNPGYKFIIFTPEHDRPAYRMTVLDESPEDAHDIFIRREDVGKFFDRQSIIKFRVDANELILFADAGVKNYETDVYFWGNGSFQHQPVDY
jgi:hypothetical protein